MCEISTIESNTTPVIEFPLSTEVQQYEYNQVHITVTELGTEDPVEIEMTFDAYDEVSITTESDEPVMDYTSESSETVQIDMNLQDDADSLAIADFDEELEPDESSTVTLECRDDMGGSDSTSIDLEYIVTTSEESETFIESTTVEYNCGSDGGDEPETQLLGYDTTDEWDEASFGRAVVDSSDDSATWQQDGFLTTEEITPTTDTIEVTATDMSSDSMTYDIELHDADGNSVDWAIGETGETTVEFDVDSDETYTVEIVADEGVDIDTLDIQEIE